MHEQCCYSNVTVLVVPSNAREVRKKNFKRDNATLDSAENTEPKQALKHLLQLDEVVDNK